MDPIASFSGISSGLEWRDMVDKIMQLEVNRRIGPVQTRVNLQEKRREAWSTFNGLLSKLSSSAQTLKDGTAFGSMQTSVSHTAAGKALFTATPSASAKPGSYQVEVLATAKADKLSGGAFASAGTELSIAGEFYVNGRRVDLVATDTLTSVRDKINALNSGSGATGVSATILSTSATEHRLVLSSDATGNRGIELTDGGSGALQSLGVITGALAQNADPADAGNSQSQRLTSSSTPLAAILGVSAPPTVTTIDVNGHKITVDLENDTLISLMNRIATAGGDASISEETVGGKLTHRLTVGGAVTADAVGSDPAASQRIVELLGFQKGVLASSIATGRNAVVEIDGFEVTRRSNVIGDVIEGVTLSLQASEPGTLIDLEISRDLGDVVNSAKSMAAAYNALVDFAASQRAPGSPLVANGSLRATMGSLSRTLLSEVGGLSAGNPYTHASIAGIELTKEGKLQVDATKLQSALETNLSDITALLTQGGSVTDGQVSYKSATAATTAGTYAIDITAAATQATHLGSAWGNPGAYAASNGVSDTLTLTDPVTGGSLDYVLTQGATLSNAVTELNALFLSQNLRLTAVEEAGALRITANEYGSAATFEVAGTAAAVLGMTAGSYAGTNVAGTIGGLAATGSGRTLTGAAGEVTEGLAVSYTGTTARAAGDIRYALGFGGMLEAVVAPIVDTQGGVIKLQLGSIDSSIDTLNKRLDDIEAGLEVRRESLIKQFTRMETAMSQLQSQSAWLNSQIQSLPSSWSNRKR